MRQISICVYVTGTAFSQRPGVSECLNFFTALGPIWSVFDVFESGVFTLVIDKGFL